ncbi:MAG: cytochrome c family protein [Mesorhizobium amorphae]|nr:MAG: cytochrome c family protein [Mesorhizobium amorphae]
MDSFEFNKVIGAVLGAFFLLFSVAIVSDAIFAAPAPERPGYVIEAAEPQAGGAAEAAERPSIAVLLASADADAGATAFKKCQACHSGEKGGPNKIGPDLWDLVNRPIATHEGFAYSGAMKEFSQGGTVVWDWDHLDHFLHGPKAYISGTAMSFAGLKRDDERANLIAYLRTLSDNPAPLPAADAAPAAEDASAPAGEAAPAAEGAAAPAEGTAPAAETPAPATDGAAAPATEGAAPTTAGEPVPAPNTGEPAANSAEPAAPAAPVQQAQ